MICADLDLRLFDLNYTEHVVCAFQQFAVSLQVLDTQVWYLYICYCVVFSWELNTGIQL